MDPENKVMNVLLKVAGKPFRCACGCNVFNKPLPISQPNIYVCNSCDTQYTAE